MKMICISQDTPKNYQWPELKDEINIDYFSGDKIVQIASTRLKNSIDLPDLEDIYHVVIKVSHRDTPISGFACMGDILDFVKFIGDDEVKNTMTVFHLFSDPEIVRINIAERKVEKRGE